MMGLKISWNGRAATASEQNSDVDLMTQIIGHKDHKAFETLYLRFGKRIRAFLFRMLPGQEELVDDILQETFTRIWENPTSYHPPKPVAPWIFTIAANLAKNEWRKMKVRNKIHAKPAPMETLNIKDAQPTPDRLADMAHFQNALQHALLILEEHHREVFLLRFQQDFSIKEISQLVQVPEGTVKSRLFYATRKLAGQLRHLENLRSESL